MIEGLLRLLQLSLVCKELFVLLFQSRVKTLQPFLVTLHLQLKFVLQPLAFGHDMLVDDLKHIFPFSVELLLDFDYLLVLVPHRFACAVLQERVADPTSLDARHNLSDLALVHLGLVAPDLIEFVS